MADIPPILTSNSAYQTFMTCPRKRWLAYETVSDPETSTRGWERQRLSLPLATGGWCHKVVQALLLMKAIGGAWVEAEPPMHQSALLTRLTASLSDWCKEMELEGQTIPSDASEVILACSRGYVAEARTRGLDLGLQMDGSLPEERFVERTIAEQAALLEAFGWAFLRVRLPRLLEEYDLLDVEREEYTLLSGDVGLQSRCDAVLRRRSDQRLFIYNLKTSGNPDKRWKDSFEVDAQLMTETLAVERRLQERVYGVIIDGFDKGVRVDVDFQTLKERPKDGAEKWQAQRSRLIYGYKCEETIPGRPTLYDYEGTTRKGWEKFAVWEESFHVANPYKAELDAVTTSPVAYWVNWLPQEQMEAAFVTLPPIMRSDRAVESAVRQMVATERKIRTNRVALEAWPTTEYETGTHSSIDEHFPQNFRSCVYPSKCWAYELCHGWAADDPASNGFQPRVANHPEAE